MLKTRHGTKRQTSQASPSARCFKDWRSALPAMLLLALMPALPKRQNTKIVVRFSAEHTPEPRLQRLHDFPTVGGCTGQSQGWTLQLHAALFEFLSFWRDLKAAWCWRSPGRLLDVVREPCAAAWLQNMYRQGFCGVSAECWAIA